MPHKFASLSAAAVAAGVLLAASAVPAFAATSDPVDTDITFTLAEGDLSLTAAANAALTNGDSGATTITGSLGAVSVTDARGGDTGWVASAVSSTFTNPAPTTTSTAVSYNSGTVTPTGARDCHPGGSHQRHVRGAGRHRDGGDGEQHRQLESDAHGDPAGQLNRG